MRPPMWWCMVFIFLISLRGPVQMRRVVGVVGMWSTVVVAVMMQTIRMMWSTVVWSIMMMWFLMMLLFPHCSSV